MNFNQIKEINLIESEQYKSKSLYSTHISLINIISK